ncbi:hypothetical protein BJA5080_08087 [Bradyrhizobium diazoefficiens SEMIA 5080]|uniref:Uncharacterized protein n=1 Tax=Bradyrhizobium diazoefficiens SEMIA 5080 TaxID=754504 RepID=A0A837CRT5_9BRAD|nr:hypothetical protein BJA5080_08087 [Bradyrhizobium diazoefficiens SEMIA 5080]
MGLRTRASELAEASHSSMRVISWKEKQGGFQCSRPGEYEPGARHSTDGYRCNRVRAAAQRFRGSRFGAGSRPSSAAGRGLFTLSRRGPSLLSILGDRTPLSALPRFSASPWARLGLAG